MRAVACCLLVLLTAACGASAPPPATSVASTPSMSTYATMPTMPPVAPTISAAPAAVPNGLLFVQSRFAPGGQSFAPSVLVLDPEHGMASRSLPPGVFAPDWLVLYTASYDGTHTQVDARDPVTGMVRRTATLEGRYNVGGDGWNGATEAGNTSPDGHWIALTGSREYQADGPIRSRFAVLDTAFAQPPRTLALDGAYTLDALANDGNALYLIENLPVEYATATPIPVPVAALRYRVVFVDVLHPSLAPQQLVDKSTQGTVMAGTRQVSVAMPDGQWLFSLYLNPKQPFIHALNLTDRYAVCIFLPAGGAPEAQAHWALARTTDGRRLYAANGATGTVTEIDTTSLSTLRTVTVPMGAAQAAANPLVVAAGWFAPLSVSAKGDVTFGSMVLSPDGKTLVLTGVKGVMLLDTRDFHRRAHVLDAQVVSGLALNPNGTRLYVICRDTNTLTEIDPDTGAVRAETAVGHDLGAILRAT